MKWSPMSSKQLKLLTWWTEESPFHNASGVIAEGAIRSGKTLIMGLSFVLWSWNYFNNTNFAICGKTVGSLRRNVVQPLKDVLSGRGFKVIDRQSDNQLLISKDGRTNIYYLFGGRDERSQDLVQGITLAGVLLDEVALMPRSFVEQCLARCSIGGSKYWFNCNPEGPQHWFYVEHVLKYKELNYLRLHFTLNDNLSLDEEIKERYRRSFSGIFYERFILGKWAFADGVIYDCFLESKNTYSNAERKKVLPEQIINNDTIGGQPYYSADYGVYNPMVWLEGYKFRKPDDSVPYFYIERELYYDGRKKMYQKSDQEYLEDLIQFIGDKKYKAQIIDPSASSMIAASNRLGIYTMKAKNDVNEGIRLVYSLMQTGHILINKDNCPMLIAELGLYIWDNKKTEKGKEQPVKANDHCCDALRYLIETTTNKWEVIGLGKTN